MIRTTLKSLAVAATLMVGGVAASTTSANAGDLSIDLRFGGPGGFFIGDRGFRGFHDFRRVCTPRKALRKARRNGLRRAHIVRVNGRRIVVAGRSRGDRVVVKFGRHRSCPTRSVRVFENERRIDRGGNRRNRDGRGRGRGGRRL